MSKQLGQGTMLSALFDCNCNYLLKNRQGVVIPLFVADFAPILAN